MSKMKYHGWEDAMDALVDEKNELRECLGKLVYLWDSEADKVDMENGFAVARSLVDNTKPKGTI